MQFLIARLIIPNLEFETLVTIPTLIVGQIPTDIPGHLFHLYPKAEKIILIDGQNVVELTRREDPKKDLN